MLASKPVREKVSKQWSIDRNTLEQFEEKMSMHRKSCMVELGLWIVTRLDSESLAACCKLSTSHQEPPEEMVLFLQKYKTPDERLQRLMDMAKSEENEGGILEDDQN